MFREIKNKTFPKLKRPRVLCDDVLTERNIYPLPNKTFAMAIIGRPGQGKSSLISSLLCDRKLYRGVFENIYLCCPPSSLASLPENHPFHHLGTHDFDDNSGVYPDLSDMDEIYERVKENCEEENKRTGEKQRSLIIIDDLSAELKNNSIKESFLKILQNRRHLRTSIIIVSHVLNLIPLPIRKALSHLIVFSLAHGSEHEIVWKEFFQIERDIYDRLIRFAFRQPHDLMLCIVDEPDLNKRFFRNWNRVEVEIPNEHQNARSEDGEREIHESGDIRKPTGRSRRKSVT